MNTMKRKLASRSFSISIGSVSMSSRWISISFSLSAALRAALMLACAAFTSDDLAHAACAPEQGVVGGQAACEPLGVLHQDVAHPVDALQQEQLDAADPRHRRQTAVGMPDIGVGSFERLISGAGRLA